MILSKRVSLLAAGGVALLLFAVLLAAVRAGVGAAPLEPLAGITAVQYASGLDDPVDLANTGVATDTRLFVVEQDGRIKIITALNTVLPTPFLSITNIVNSEAYEMGLLGLAFSPNYASNGHFFVYYNTNSGDIRLARYTVSGNPNVADPTEMVILDIPHPDYTNHNGGDLAFGPDGYLYLAPGDGGGTPEKGQDLTTLLGKVLRLNVTGVATYTIPASNPFTATAGLDQIWAYGLRNPFRFSFDRETGDFYVGDVGAGAWEEIDFQAAGTPGGVNYGWRCYEGNHVGNLSGCPQPGNYTFPVAEYCNEGQGIGCDDGGRAVIGGHVYRGQDNPAMVGVYFFADNSSNRFWAMLPTSWSVSPLDIGNVPGPSGFGEDVDGELYVTSLVNDSVYRLQGSIYGPVETPSFLPIIRR